MISVVTITFNNFIELKATLESLKLCHYPLELVIVNGGSCEKSDALIKDFEVPYFSIKKISEKDKGIADAFNKGVRAAQDGAFITFLNSGDILLRGDYYQKADEYLKAHPKIDFIHSNLIFDGELTGKVEKEPALCELGRGMPYYHQTMIVRKSVFDSIGLFDLQFKMAMDFHFVVRMQKQNKKGYYMPLHPPAIQMDGHGVSVQKEWGSILECRKALQIEDELSLTQFSYFSLRVFLYGLRKFLTGLKMKKILSILKKKKKT